MLFGVKRLPGANKKGTHLFSRTRGRIYFHERPLGFRALGESVKKLDASPLCTG
jgi:hypothetical protein